MATASGAPALRERLQRYSISSLWLISLCFILSGATGLIYEILWARMLGLVFGATTFAISAVLAAFMGGLALGSAVAGRFGARLKRPLRAYGMIEVGIALYALCVPLLFRVVDHLYAAMWEQFHPGFYAFSLWRFLLSSAVLLVPTTLMGATLPVLSAALLLRSNLHSDTSVARLYTCNLVGAIFGTLVAGFILLPHLGVRATIYTAAAINILIGIAAWFIDLKGMTTSADEEAADATAPAGRAPVITRELEESRALLMGEDSLGRNEFWLLCAAVSGFVTISTQVAWTRVLTMVIGSSTYAFSVVVALFLLGLSGGAYVISRQKTVQLRRWLFKVELATTVALFLSLEMINRMPGLLIDKGLEYNINSWLGLLALQTFVAALLILIPAFLMGMVMPLVLVWASSRESSASVKWVGRSYAVNTLGAIAGAFMTGFVLIPKVGTRFTIIFATWLCVIVAGLAYKPVVRKGVDATLRRALAAGATLLLVIGLYGFAPRPNLADLSKGAYDGLVRQLARARFGARDDEDAASRASATHRLLMYEEGPTATVTVREDWGIRSVAINGRANASDNPAVTGDMPTQVMLAQLPLLIAPRAETGLIVGFASGVSVGSMLQSPIRSLECVELEPATVNASRFFEHVNNRPLTDARLRLMIDDARSYLRVNPTLYDMIVSEPSHPWVPGVANLFTREFFELGRSRLNAEGVFVQWLQIYQLSTESLRTVLATYLEVFPHVMVFRVGGAAKGKDLILVGSRAPLTLDRLGERMSDSRMRAELARVRITEPGDVESWYVCDETQLGLAVAGAVINTDDNMLVENRAPREAFLPMTETNAAWIETLSTRRQK